MTRHQFNMEQLTHMQCGRCRGYWSMSDVTELHSKTWACPHCEYVAKASPMAPLKPGGNNGNRNESTN